MVDWNPVAVLESLIASGDWNPQQMDVDSGALQSALKSLCQAGLMSLRRPKEYGGPNCDESDFRAFQESVARWSGALAFLQTQHQSAVSLIVKGSNEALKQRLLPSIHEYENLLGIGFSQLRRPGSPMVTATPDGSGYRISGKVPWVTGEGFFRHYLIGASLEDGRAVFGVVPLTRTPEIQIGAPMRLAAMESARTVEVDLDGHFLASDDIVDIKPSGWIFKNDQINITLQGFFALGCSLAGVDVVRAAYSKRGNDFLACSANALEQEIQDCRAHMISAQQRDAELTTDEKLALRGWAIDLCMRCAHAAVAASGGQANSIHHPAQRILREALVFTVSAQTEAIMEGTLKRLIERRSHD